jgi:hypothetical protein
MKLRFWYILPVLALILTAGACKKNTDLVAAQYTSNLNVINATDTPFNIYVNGTRLNSTSNIYGPGYSGYLTVPASTQSYAIEHPINIYANPLPTPTVLFTKTLTLSKSQTYSLFVAGSTSSSAFLHQDTLISATDLDSYSGVRFVHAAPSSGSLSVALNDTVRFSSAKYQSVSSFIKQTTGTTTIKLYAAGNTTPIATATLTLSAGTNYTLYAKDIKSGTVTTASLGYLLN